MASLSTHRLPFWSQIWKIEFLFLFMRAQQWKKFELKSQLCTHVSLDLWALYFVLKKQNVCYKDFSFLVLYREASTELEQGTFWIWVSRLLIWSLTFLISLSREYRPLDLQLIRFFLVLLRRWVNLWMAVEWGDEIPSVSNSIVTLRVL